MIHLSLLHYHTLISIMNSLLNAYVYMSRWLVEHVFLFDTVWSMVFDLGCWRNQSTLLKSNYLDTYLGLSWMELQSICIKIECSMSSILALNILKVIKAYFSSFMVASTIWELSLEFVDPISRLFNNIIPIKVFKLSVNDSPKVYSSNQGTVTIKHCWIILNTNILCKILPSCLQWIYILLNICLL